MTKYLPKKIHIETVLGCNSRCIMCPNSEEKTVPIKKMKGSLFEKIIKDIISVTSITSIKLSVNGETLLDDKIVEKILFIKKRKKIRITFNTNAFLLNERLSRRLIKSGLDRINFHISGFSPKIYQKVMAGLSRKKVFGNILDFQKIAKENNSKIVMAIKYVIIKENAIELQKAKKFWEHKGFLFRPDILDSRIGSLKKYNRLQLKRSKKTLSACPLIYEHFFIRYNGDIVTCWSDWYSRRIMGNMKKEKILDIFNNRKFNQLRRELLRGRKLSKSICADCSWEDKDAK